VRVHIAAYVFEPLVFPSSGRACAISCGVRQRSFTRSQSTQEMGVDDQEHASTLQLIQLLKRCARRDEECRLITGSHGNATPAPCSVVARQEEPARARAIPPRSSGTGTSDKLSNAFAGTTDVSARRLTVRRCASGCSAVGLLGMCDAVTAVMTFTRPDRITAVEPKVPEGADC
jgi:hypothetical protein